MKYEVQGISEEFHQTFDVSAPEIPEKIKMTMRYLPTQLAWYLDFSYKDIAENGIKVVPSPNILRTYRNILPFGLSIYAEDGIYPMEPDAFSNGRVKIYVLTQDYVENLEESVYAR